MKIFRVLQSGKQDNGPEFTSHLFQSWLEEQVYNGLKSKKVSHNKMQLLNDLIVHIVRIFYMQIYLEP
jgi:hypothetical protein